MHEKTFSKNISCSECGARSIFGAELWAYVLYDTNTGWITDVDGCYIDIITGSPAHPNFFTYNDSYADWDWGSDETSLVFHGIIDVGFAEGFTPDNPMEPGWLFEHYFYGSSSFNVTFNF